MLKKIKLKQKPEPEQKLEQQLELELKDLERIYFETIFALGSKLVPSKIRESNEILQQYNEMKSKLENLTNKKYDLPSFADVKKNEKLQLRQLQKYDTAKYKYIPNDKIDMQDLYKPRGKKLGVLI